MKSQKDYWEKHILNWEDSAYGRKSRGSITERLANLFRGHLVHRKNSCKKRILPKVGNLNVLEIGTGSAFLLEEIAREGHPKRITGWEISKHAAEMASARLEKLGLSEQAKIQCRSIENSIADVEPFDLVYGLGILEYLEKQTVQNLFNLLKNKLFFFQFHKKDLSFKNGLHLAYRTIKNIPIYNQYTEKEILGVCQNAQIPRNEISILAEKGNHFISRL